MPKISPQYEQTQRRRILDGAARVFAEHGYGLTTVDQICQALQLSKGALYIYYPSKEELFIAVLQVIFERRYASLAGAFHPEDALRVKFEKLLDRLGGLVDAEDTLFLRLWVEGFLQSQHMPALEALKTASHRQFDDLLQGLLREGQASGEIDAGLDLSGAAEVLMAVADGLMLHSLVPGWGIGPARVRSILQDTFSHLLADPDVPASSSSL
jgi:AcrR family transcriptional regulator